jgi:hypothetical protein
MRYGRDMPHGRQIVEVLNVAPDEPIFSAWSARWRKNYKIARARLVTKNIKVHAPDWSGDARLTIEAVIHVMFAGGGALGDHRRVAKHLYAIFKRGVAGFTGASRRLLPTWHSCHKAERPHCAIARMCASQNWFALATESARAESWRERFPASHAPLGEGR